MAKEALYTLLENEKVIFELKIANATRNDMTSTAVAGMIKSILPGGEKQNAGGSGIFVVTNMRCFVALQRKSGGCCFAHEDRFFWSFPLKALNGCNGYDSSQSSRCCCCKSSSFSISIGINKFTLRVYTNEIKNHEQAQAVVAKLSELAQKSNQ